MGECFLINGSGGSSKSDVQPVTLFEGHNNDYFLADGFTGFSEYHTDTPTPTECLISKWQNTSDESQYGYRIGKPYSSQASESNYMDSAVIVSNEPIDLTNYNAICIYFYGTCDYNSSSDKMGAYFRIDTPDILPQSNVSYDWSPWDNMFMYYRKYGRYYYDVSQVTGEHHLCFGIYHGTYHIGYTNGIKIYKMMLM